MMWEPMRFMDTRVLPLIFKQTTAEPSRESVSLSKKCIGFRAFHLFPFVVIEKNYIFVGRNYII